MATSRSSRSDAIGAGSSSRAAGISTGLLWTKTGILARKTALRRFREMSRELDGYVFHNEHGCLGLFSPEPGLAARPCCRSMTSGTPYRVLSAAEIRRRWPMLNPPDDYLMRFIRWAATASCRGARRR